MDTSTYLSVDIGSQHTRAWLFSNRSGSFDLAASASVGTTAAAGADIQAGVLAALEQVQKTTGYRLLDHDQKIIRSMDGMTEGVQRVGLSMSAGKPIRTALIAVSNTYSLAALRRLANYFYTKIVLEVNLQDDVNATAQLEKMMRTNADLYVIAGGVDGGAARSVRAAIDNVRLAYLNVPRPTKPQIVFTGNSELAEYANRELDFGPDFHLAGNIQPRLGKESLTVAWLALLEAFARIRSQQIPGLSALQQKCDTRVLPTAYAMGRVVRLLSRIAPSGKGVLALDVGGGSTTLLACRGDDFIGTISHAPISNDVGRETCRFSAQAIDAETAAVYMHNKKLHPAFLPATLEDLAIEHAWTRVRIRYALQHTRALYPDFKFDPTLGLLESYEPVILSGESLLRVPALHQSLLMALDGLCQHGITTFAMDQNQVMAGLGSLADADPMVTAQIIDAGIFHNLGTAICVDNPERLGRKVLNLEVDHGDRPRELLEVRKGEIKRVEVLPDQKTRLYLSPTAESNVGMGLPGLGGWVTVVGSEVGVVIDARGRPLELPENKNERSEMIYNWLWELGG